MFLVKQDSTLFHHCSLFTLKSSVPHQKSKGRKNRKVCLARNADLVELSLNRLPPVDLFSTIGPTQGALVYCRGNAVLVLAPYTSHVSAMLDSPSKVVWVTQECPAIIPKYNGFGMKTTIKVFLFQPHPASEVVHSWSF